MFKNLLKAGLTFTLLLGGYFVYGHAFELVVQQLRRYHVADTSFPIRPSRSKEHATALAKESFGPDHWSVTTDHLFAYYNAERGFWMFSLDVQEIQEENGIRYDGKRLKMRPFAMIWKSSDGKSNQMLTADRATLDLNQPVGLSNKQSNESIKVEHALIEQNVRMRDERGTPRKLSDDMNVTMDWVRYDEATQKITTESHVVFQDPDQTTIGDGMLIQLRKKDPNTPSSQSSSGFEGAEFAILYKNVWVHLRDMGDSGVMPVPAPKRKAPAKAVDLKIQVAGSGPAGKTESPTVPTAPSPMDIMSEGPMRVDFARNAIPAEEGPPEAPAPTLVRFERNVVALFGHPGLLPDQLNCDTLRLTLVPASKLPQPKPSRTNKDAPRVPGDAVAGVSGDPAARAPAGPASEGGARADAQGRAAGAGAPPQAGVVAQSGPGGDGVGAVAGDVNQVKPGAGKGDETGSAPSAGASSGPFGNLTLQRAHGTGHAVWLQLREQGTKVRCNELIYERRYPYEPDLTYLRGDVTRPMWLEKIDREPVGSGDEKTRTADGTRSTSSPGQLAQAGRPRQGKITGVTHVLTLDATIFDKGEGLDLANIIARGPGRLESRPDFQEPVERIAVWQDELTIENILGPESQLLQKKVVLTGTRPYFVDTVQKTSLDSGESIYVWLKPKASAKEKTTGSPVTPTVSADPSGAPASSQVASANGGAGGDAQSASQTTTGGGLGGGGLEVERILAYRDVHSLAPDRKLEARKDLELRFVEADPTPVVASTTSAPSDGTAEAAAPDPAQGSEPAQAQGQVAAQKAPQKPPAEPSNTGVADRIWALVARKPGSGLDPTSRRRRTRTAAKPTGPNGNVAAVEEAGAPTAQSSSPGDSESEILEAWLRGNVALHQDSPPDKPENPDGTKAKPKSQDITGEAVYMDNHKGKGKMLAWVFYRDPSQPPRPGPLPWARVANDEMTIRCEKIRLDQEHDKVWGDGPGVLTQWTDRALFTDKAEEPTGDSGAGPDASAAAPRSSPRGGDTIRTSYVIPPGPDTPTGIAPAVKPKPRTRAGRPVSDKELLTITWTKRMEFTGRTIDPTGRRAGRADFFGLPNAITEDAQLKCIDRMIVFTDREVPLGELGSLSKGSVKTDGADADGANDDGKSKNSTQADLALIYCYGESLAVSRKIDADLPIWLEKQMIYAEQELQYNRLTGDFRVPGPGRVYKWDRSDDSEKKKDGADQDGANVQQGDRVDGQTQRGGRANVPGRPVTPTSSRTAAGGRSSVGADGRTTSASQRPTSAAASRNADRPSQPATPPHSRKIPPLVLTQIFFEREMQGKFLTGQENEQSQKREAIFFGDIQFRRAEVRSVDEAFDFDKPLPEKGFYMTSQILRLIQEPPPAGSPEATPARTLAKAWDDVIVNKGDSAVLRSDMATYDSVTDKLYAYGEGDRGVVLAQQYGVGQKPSPAYGKAVQFNVKTGAIHFINSDVVQFFDKKTGSRPQHVPRPDPNVPKKKKKNPVFKVPNQNMERRGFTGQ
jgi:hypothetical protein